MRSAALSLLLIGCGFSAGGAAKDAGPGSGIDAPMADATDAPILVIDAPDAPDAPAIDAPIDAPPPSCLAHWHDHSVTITSVDALATLNTTGFERDPFLTPSELDIYFARGTGGNGDVYTAHRAHVVDAFGTATRVDGLSSNADDSKVSLTADGLFATVTSRRGTAGTVLIYGSIHDPVTGTFSTPMAIPGLGPDPQYDGMVSADASHLYLAPVSSGDQVIAVSTRTGVAYGMYAPIAELNQQTPNADPSVTDSETILVFSTRRSGDQSDIWYSTRSDATQPWAPPTALDTAMVDLGASNEGDPHLSPDGCRLYFARDTGSTNSYDLFVATIAP